MAPTQVYVGGQELELGLGENVCRGWGDRRGEVKEKEDVKALRKGTHPHFSPKPCNSIFCQNQKPSQTSEPL